MSKPEWLKLYMVAVAGVLVLLSAAGLFASGAARGKAAPQTTLVSYSQSGKFSYVTYLKPSYLYGPIPQTAPPDAQYPLAAVGNVDFTFGFSPTSKDWAGYASVDAILENAGLWRKTIALVPRVAVAGDFTLNFTVNPDEINAVFDQIEAGLGINASPRTLRLSATIDSGNGSAVQDLPIQLDRSSMQISSELSQKVGPGAGRFDYTVNRKAASAPDASYPIELVSGLSFRFDFAPISPGSATTTVEAVLENPGVWQKAITLVPATAGSSSVSLPFGVDLGSIQKQFDDIDAQTKISSSPRIITLRATVASANETFAQTLRLVIDRELLQVPGDLVLTLPQGTGSFDYSINLKPNSLYSSSTLRPSQAPSSSGGGSAGYEINLKAPSEPATIPTTTLPPDQPAFVKLVDRIDATFSYEFKSDQPVTGLNTDVELVATIEAPQMWSKQLELLHESESGSFTLSFPLDIAAYSSLIDSIRNETGVSPDSIAISVTANIRATGQTSFGPINATFSPAMKGTIKGNVLEWDKELKATQPGSIQRAAGVATPAEFLGLPAASARSIFVALMVCFVLVFGALLALYLRPSQSALSGAEEEVLQIKRKYGVRIVEGTGSSSPWGNNLVSVGSIQDLIKASDELAKPVVHQSPPDKFGLHSYYIIDGNNRYQYQVASDTGRTLERPGES